MAELREKFDLDMSSAFNSSRREGQIKGRKESRKEGRREDRRELIDEIKFR